MSLTSEPKTSSGIETEDALDTGAQACLQHGSDEGDVALAEAMLQVHPDLVPGRLVATARLLRDDRDDVLSWQCQDLQIFRIKPSSLTAQTLGHER